MVRAMIEGLKLRKRPVRIDRDRRIEESPYVVIDTELTGLDEKRDAIVSIGAVRMAGSRILLGETFYSLVNPERFLTAESVIIHQITPQEVSQKPDIQTVLTDFLDFCGDDIIVGFCVDIDTEFLNRDTRKHFGCAIPNHVIDIRPMFEWIAQRENFRTGSVCLPPQYGLYDIARYFGVPVNGGHNAIIDAFITAQVFQRVLCRLGQSGIESLGDLLKMSNRIRGGDRHDAARKIGNL